MSEEHVQVARAAIDAWNDGDMDRLRNLYDPAVVFRPPPDWVDAGLYTMRNRLIVGLEFFRSREEALQVLELSE